jgi:hypothetical protein
MMPVCHSVPSKAGNREPCDIDNISGIIQEKLKIVELTMWIWMKVKIFARLIPDALIGKRVINHYKAETLSEIS